MITLDEVKVCAVAARNFPKGLGRTRWVEPGGKGCVLCSFLAFRHSIAIESLGKRNEIVLARFSEKIGQPTRDSDCGELLDFYASAVGTSRFAVPTASSIMLDDLTTDPLLVAAVFQLIADIWEGKHFQEKYIRKEDYANFQSIKT
jgi:hypothetical protein